MKKIAIIVSNPCVNDSRVLKMAFTGLEAGYETIIFATAAQDIPNFEINKGLKIHRFEWKPAKQLIAKNPILRTINFLSRKMAVGTAKRLVPYFKYFLMKEIFFKSIIEFNPDIIHAHDLITLPTACYIAKITGAKVVYDAHEFERYRFPKLSFLQYHYVSYIEKKYSAFAHTMITVGDMIQEELKKLLNRDDIKVIYNAPRIEKSNENIHNRLQFSADKTIILYVGKVSKGRGIEHVLNALILLPVNYVLVCLGHTVKAYEEDLIRLSEQLNLTSRFILQPPVPENVLVGYIQSAAIGVIPVEPLTMSYKYCMPNKLFELSFANVPIVANKLDNIDLFLKKFHNGVVVDFLNYETLADSILFLAKNRDEYLFNDFSNSELYKKYSWEAQQKKLIEIYKNMLLDKRPT